MQVGPLSHAYAVCAYETIFGAACADEALPCGELPGVRQGRADAALQDLV